MDEKSPRSYSSTSFFSSEDILGEQIKAVMSKQKDWKEEALSDLAGALADAGQWERFERLADKAVKDRRQRKTLKSFGESLARNGQYEQLLHLVQHAFFQAGTSELALNLLVLVYGLLPLKPEMGMAFFQKIV